jgi:hypothetical protein
MEHKKVKTKLKPFIKHIIFTFFMVFFAFVSYFLLTIGLDNKKIIKINYKENNNIDYKVYLKPNTFFENSYLPQNSTYISTLINYIDANFNFKFNYDRNVTGTYTYYIKGTLIANKVDNNSKSYLTKEYQLTDPISGTINNQNNFSIFQNIKIDYQKYNDLLTEFKKEYGLTIDGKLKVELIVNSVANIKETNNPIKDSSSMYIEIPLTELSVDININTNPQVKSNSIILDTTYINDFKHKSFMGGGLISALIVIILFVNFIKELHMEKMKISFYNKELSRILLTYDSIIVTIDKIKDLSNYNIIKVDSFNELLDAHNEIRMPINFIEVKRNAKSLFFLINDNVVWVYELNNLNEVSYEKN